MNPRYAILLDGGFVSKVIEAKKRADITAADIEAECERIVRLPALGGLDLLRIYYYDAPPATQNLTNPIDRSVLDLGSSKIHAKNTALLDQLELLPNFAVRKGETVVRGWKLGAAAMKQMLAAPRLPTARDLVPNVQQKGVDLRIGLDVARLALRQIAQVIVVVTGDSDMIPVFKFARREGLRVYLDHLGGPVRKELRVHADIVL